MEQLEKLRQEMSNKKSGGKEQEGESDSENESNGRSKENGDRSEKEKKKEGQSSKLTPKTDRFRKVKIGKGLHGSFQRRIGWFQSRSR